MKNIRFSFLLFFVGKLDFHHELEKFSQSYNIFFTTYNKLKKFWNLASRSTHANVIIKNIVKRGVKLPSATRWNSEWDSMGDAYQKRVEVCSMYKINLSMTKCEFSSFTFRSMKFSKNFRNRGVRDSRN